jgi:hypothetical protein
MVQANGIGNFPDGDTFKIVRVDVMRDGFHPCFTSRATALRSNPMPARHIESQAVQPGLDFQQQDFSAGRISTFKVRNPAPESRRFLRRAFPQETITGQQLLREGLGDFPLQYPRKGKGDPDSLATAGWGEKLMGNATPEQRDFTGRDLDDAAGVKIAERAAVHWDIDLHISMGVGASHDRKIPHPPDTPSDRCFVSRLDR